MVLICKRRQLTFEIEILVKVLFSSNENVQKHRIYPSAKFLNLNFPKNPIGYNIVKHFWSLFFILYPILKDHSPNISSSNVNKFSKWENLHGNFI